MSGHNDVRGVIMDLDGVVYRGGEVLPGAADFFTFLRATGRSVVALTNHSGRTANAYSMKLAGLGVELEADRIITSAWAAATYVRRSFPGARVFVVGTSALEQELRAEDVVLAEEEVDLVVVGFVERLAEAPLQQAIEHLLKGARLIATNPDPVLPVPGGFVAECGPVMAYLEAASGCRAHVIGKPNPWIVDLALERLGVAREESLLVGDTLATDVAAARASHVKAALVLTGNTALAPDAPDLLVAKDLRGLLEALRTT